MIVPEGIVICDIHDVKFDHNVCECMFKHYTRLQCMMLARLCMRTAFILVVSAVLWWKEIVEFLKPYFDGLVQDCSISIANALEILQPCTKPSVSWSNLTPFAWTWRPVIA